MGLYRSYIFPRLSDIFLDNPRLNAQRQKALAMATGTVLEVGFGSGLNLPFYPEAVTSLVALDPSQQAFKLAKRRIENATFPVKHIPQLCETAALAAQKFDCVVTTWTLCTVNDPLAILRKLRNLIAPGGRLLFLEHGQSSSCITNKLQEYWNPIHRRLCAGCNVNRPIDALIRAAGFHILLLERFKLYSPELFFATYRGVAVPKSDEEACFRPE
jgi:ubiquinone/menaquinone biosynthesis C-methylase UbiE